jgi:DNA primase
MQDTFFDELTSVCHNLLLDNQALMHYLRNHRGISDETIKKYRLGAFPKDLRDLYDRYSLDPVQLREKEIVWNADQSQFKLYPVVIPVTNINNNVVAIGCRTLLTEERRKNMGIPKYRNSKYKKTAYLFGLDKAYSSIRKNDIVFVVEGYFDVLMAHQNGISNVVATCGTMFSERQLVILSRYTKKICLLFDNDKPGRISAKKVMSKLDNYSNEVSLMCKFTPEGYKDLDEYLRKGGSSKLFTSKSEKLER